MSIIPVTVNYKANAAKQFREATRSFLEQIRDINLLALATWNLSLPNNPLPSWVWNPRSANPGSLNIRVTSRHCGSHATQHSAGSPAFSDYGSLFGLTGYVLDKIQETGLFF